MTDSARIVDAKNRRRQQMMLLLLLGAAVAAALYLWIKFARNEPTIIIRGGSILFEVVGAEWIEADPENPGGPAEWTHNGQGSSSKLYLPTLAATESGGERCAPVPAEVDRVNVHSSRQGKAVMLHFRTEKTHLKPDNHDSLLEREGGQQNVLKLRKASDQQEDDQQVQRVQLHKQGTAVWNCRFEKGEFQSLTLQPN